MSEVGFCNSIVSGTVLNFECDCGGVAVETLVLPGNMSTPLSSFGEPAPIALSRPLGSKRAPAAPDARISISDTCLLLIDWLLASVLNES